MNYLFLVTNTINKKIEKKCSTSLEVMNFIKKYLPSNFWDMTINDYEDTVTLFNKDYLPCEVLKQIDKKHYDYVCENLWKDYIVDICKELDEMESADIKMLDGFMIVRL